MIVLLSVCLSSRLHRLLVRRKTKTKERLLIFFLISAIVVTSCFRIVGCQFVFIQRETLPYTTPTLSCTSNLSSCFFFFQSLAAPILLFPLSSHLNSLLNLIDSPRFRFVQHLCLPTTRHSRLLRTCVCNVLSLPLLSIILFFSFLKAPPPFDVLFCFSRLH